MISWRKNALNGHENPGSMKKVMIANCIMIMSVIPAFINKISEITESWKHDVAAWKHDWNSQDYQSN